MTENPLSTLKDIHLPQPPGLWPVAAGWYGLIFIVSLLLITAAVLLYRYYRRGRPRREALRQLAACEQQYAAAETSADQISARISELLKRVALVYFPRSEVASLQGEAWINFLQRTAKNMNSSILREGLLELPYKKSSASVNLQPLFRCARNWIKQRSRPCSS